MLCGIDITNPSVLLNNMVFSLTYYYRGQRMSADHEVAGSIPGISTILNIARPGTKFTQPHEDNWVARS